MLLRILVALVIFALFVPLSPAWAQTTDLLGLEGVWHSCTNHEDSFDLIPQNHKVLFSKQGNLHSAKYRVEGNQIKFAGRTLVMTDGELDEGSTHWVNGSSLLATRCPASSPNGQPVLSANVTNAPEHPAQPAVSGQPTQTAPLVSPARPPSFGTATPANPQIGSITGQQMLDLLVARNPIPVEWPSKEEKSVFRNMGGRFKDTFYWCNDDDKRGKFLMDAAEACSEIAGGYKQAGDFPKEWEALVLGCRNDGWNGRYGAGVGCQLLVARLFALGNVDAAKAAMEQHPGCYNINGGGDLSPCFSTALAYRQMFEQGELKAMAKRAYSTGDPVAAGYLQSIGEPVDEVKLARDAAVRGKWAEENRQQQAQRAEEDAQEKRAEHQAKFNAIMDALQSLPGGSNPNAIQQTANEQIAAIHAIAAANAAAQQQAAQRQGAVPVQGTGGKSHCVGASGADSGYNNGCQLVQLTNSVSNYSSGRGTGGNTGGNSPAGAVGTDGSNSSSANGTNVGSTGTASHYVTPLSASCIGQFWDPKYYNWLSFQNNCGQPINLTYAGGISGATDDLGPGQATNTGWSQAEVTQKGVFNLYVCPAGYIPVDSSSDQVVNRPNQTFTCRQR